MSDQQFAKQMKDMIVSIKAEGTLAIPCDNLITYLSSVEQSPATELSVLEIERFKAQLENWVNANTHDHEANMEMFRSVITAGQSALKASFLLNGGGAVAMLAFIGHLAQFNIPMVSVFSNCIVPFSSGVLLTTVASGATYSSQLFYAGKKRWHRAAGIFFHALSALVVIASYLTFLWGVSSALNAFRFYH